MFPDTQLVKKFDGEERYDKFVLAGALSDISFNGVTCSLLEEEIISDCEHCRLNYLCNSIENVIEDYTSKTTVVTGKFNF